MTQNFFMRELHESHGEQPEHFRLEEKHLMFVKIALIVVFSVLFLCTALSCGRNTCMPSEELSGEDEFGTLSPEERRERRAQVIKRGLKTKRWTCTEDSHQRSDSPMKDETSSSTIDDDTTAGSCSTGVDDSAPQKDSSPTKSPSQRISSLLQTASSSNFLVASISKMVFPEQEDEEVCAICLNEFEGDDIVAYSTNANCTHEYHEECITSWLMKNNECPLCRNIFLEEDNVDIEKQSIRESSHSTASTGDESSRDQEVDGDSRGERHRFRHFFGFRRSS